MRLRWKNPRHRPPFRVPLTVGKVALLPAAGLIASLALLTQLDCRALATGALLLLGTIAVYLLMRRIPPP